MIKLYFSTVKTLAQRPTHISAVATLLLERERERQTERVRDRESETESQRQRSNGRVKSEWSELSVLTRTTWCVPKSVHQPEQIYYEDGVQF